MAAFTQTWVFVTLCLLFLVRPITVLWKKNGDGMDSSKINHLEADITTELSDGEQKY